MAENSDSLLSFDIFFRSYDEPYADENYELLKSKVPNLRRVHGVKGEVNAIRWAANESRTGHFVTIDADTVWNDDFSFLIKNLSLGSPVIHVWRSRNPVNGLVYGHGSIHLWNKQHVLDIESFDGIDFTLGSATKGYFIQEECATTTHFNRSSFLSWRSGFKEGTKLASATNIFPNSKYDEVTSLTRLKIWCSVGTDVDFGKECILGARMGAAFGFEHKESPHKTYELKNYEVLWDMWREMKVEENIETLLVEFAQKLAREYDFEVVLFDSDQSRFLRSVWYKVNFDVISRLAPNGSRQFLYL